MRDGPCGKSLQFAFALTVSGVSIGLMYSLIALGFVLVYKATDAINFAQGEFVMLAGFVAALALAAEGMPVLAAVAVGRRRHGRFGFALERVVLRPLLGRPIIAVIMATIGLGAMLRGLPPITVGGETRAVPLPIGDEPIVLGPAHRCRRSRSLGVVVSLRVPRRLHLVLPEEPHGRRHARRGRQPAGGDGHGHQRRALLRARLGDGRHRLGARRRRSGAACWASTCTSPWSASRCSRW